ncbi:signal recognition particle protein [Proteus mirabilis]|uniref:Signal recognition particle protein n=1 Tax=Proteus mirabilis TaxID=584 RepID=A0A379FHS5_PROMI|nr:signal recognition particle protein [Proteus mirabilis]
MFENLSDRLSRTLRNISGRGRLTEENIKDTLREVRMALLEADVALPWFVSLLHVSKRVQ